MAIQSARQIQTSPDHRAQPPGPKGWPLLGVGPIVLRDPLKFFTETTRVYGDIAYFTVGSLQFYLINHPDYLQYVLQENNRNYHKGVTYDKIRPLLGDGLVTSDGAYWLRQRRLIQPAFHRKRLANLAGLMTTATAAMLERWEAAARNHQVLNVADQFMHLTLEIVSHAMFSTDTSDVADRVGQQLPILLERTNEMFWTVFDTSHWPLPRNRQYWRAVRELNAIVYRIVDKRRQSRDVYDDVLTMLLEAHDEDTGEQMTDAQLRDEVMTIYLAGHETTANALAWAYALLGQHPDIHQRLRAEIDEVLRGRVPTVEDLPDLKYTRQVIDETLRLYPTAWTISRTPLEADVIAGYRIPAGSVVAMSMYLTHRHPAFWEDPEEFKPERFAPAQAAQRHPFAYLPFSAGPRQCIGNNFALMEAQLILAMIEQRYRLALVPDYPLVPQPVVTLRPRYGVHMTLESR